MKEFDPKLLKELPLQFQRIKIRKKKKSLKIYSNVIRVKIFQSTQVECENFSRPISKILILKNEI